MPVFISDEEIERFIREDVAYFDLTTFALGIGALPGRITFATRHDTVVCGVEEAGRVLTKLGAIADIAHASGERLPAGTLFLAATGPAQTLHQGWKVAVNLLEYASGIATRARAMVDAARSVNPAVGVMTTRKTFPGSRALAIKAVLSGGAMPHRLGLSETVLAFDQHLAFLGGLPGLLRQLDDVRRTCREKLIGIEVTGPDDALTVARAGVDVIQFDKLAPETLAEIVPRLRQIRPHVVLAAAGGIALDNVRAYATTGVDLLVTSALYFGKPADIEAKLTPESDAAGSALPTTRRR